MEDVYVVDFIPGRVRLKVRRIQGAPAFAQEVQAALAGVPGVHGIDISTVTGSVLVTYDPEAIARPEAAERLSEVLRALFPALDVPMVLAWLGATDA